jgi:hypothetical protein
MDEPENPTFRLRRAKEEVLESTEGHGRPISTRGNAT